ncbi:MAG TPA: GntR family transcriptional regulator, partial [Solirubrobacterales bacterium]|nr:GntR family transcriptional regulator [Solirubrobacterales bacterium]
GQTAIPMPRVPPRADAAPTRADQTLRDRAYRHLLQQIVSLSLGPDEVIDEARLMQQLGIGRTPIREALFRLKLERLVNVIPYRGVVVTGLRYQDLQEALELRLPLEGVCGRLAAERITPTQLETLRRLERRHQRRAAEELAAIVELDREFHAVLLEATQNAFLTGYLGHLQTICLRFWHYLIRRHAISDPVFNYADIIQALERRDATTCEGLLKAHFSEFARYLSPQPPGVAFGRDGA